MSFTEKRLCNPTQLTTSGQTLYTVPASKTAIIKQIVVTNVTASAATFSLYIGSAATPNALFSATSVAANDTIIVNLSQVLNALETLTALASSNSSLNITISGVENDGPLNPLSVYIADQSITTAKLADSSVTTAKIAAGAVINADIANNAVTQSKLASNLSGVTITTSSTRAIDIPSPFRGQLSYLTDIDELNIYNGSTWLTAVVTADDENISTSGGFTSTGTTSTTGLQVGLSGSPAKFYSSSGDNWNIRTHTNAPTPNFSLGVQNGSGSDSHVPIYWFNNTLTLRGSGTSSSNVYVDSNNNFIYPRAYAFVEGPTSGGGTTILAFTGTTHTSNSSFFSVSSSGITINRTARYYVDAAYRSSGADTYAYLGISGDRATLENRSDSGWTHDHSGYSQGHTHSKYIGYLQAGWTLTLGSSNTNIQYGSGGFSGYIFCFYIGD